MVSRVDIIADGSFLFQFFEIDVVANGHMVGGPLEDLIVATEIRALKTHLILQFMSLLHFLLVFEEQAPCILVTQTQSAVEALSIRFWLDLRISR